LGKVEDQRALGNRLHPCPGRGNELAAKIQLEITIAQRRKRFRLGRKLIRSDERHLNRTRFPGHESYSFASLQVALG
jgi:hypothetical protein